MSSSKIGRAEVVARILEQEPGLTADKLSCVPNKVLLKRVNKPKPSTPNAKAS